MVIKERIGLNSIVSYGPFTNGVHVCVCVGSTNNKTPGERERNEGVMNVLCLSVLSAVL